MTKWNPTPLTPRQKRVIDLYESGMSQTQIARSEGVSRQCINQIVYKEAHKSRKATNLLVFNGGIPDPTTLKCAYCGKQATEYDHRDFSKPEEVDAVCHKCNNRLGMGKNGRYDQAVIPKPKTKREERRVIIRDLIPYSTDLASASKKLHISKSYLGSILNCTMRPGPALVVRICKMFPQIKPHMLRPDIFEAPKESA